MSFLLEAIKTTSAKWFGKSDSYTSIYFVYLMFAILTIDVKRFYERKVLVVCVRLLQAFQMSACAYCYVAFVIDTYQQRHDMEKFTLSLCFSIFFLVVTVRVAVNVLKHKQLQAVVDALGNDLYLDFIGRSEGDLAIINSRREKFESIFKLYCFICAVGNFFRIACKMIDRVTLIPLPYIDSDDSAMYSIMFVWDVIGIYYLFTLYLFHEVNVTGILIRIEQHYMILEKNITDLRKVFPDEEGDGAKFGRKIKTTGNKLQQKKIFQQLKKSVIHHQEIIKIIHRVNDLYHESFLINIFGGGTLLVILYFHLTLNAKSYTMTFVICQTIYSMGAVIDIIDVCFYGSKIQHASHTAAQALYSSPWLKMDLNNRRILRFFQMALWKEPKIKAGFTYSLDLKFFVSFLHSIYTYLAFMQNALNREQ